jgi:Proteolipid membrane potential modulator
VHFPLLTSAIGEKLINPREEAILYALTAADPIKIVFALHFWLNILLTVLGYGPGIIHALT